VNEVPDVLVPLHDRLRDLHQRLSYSLIREIEGPQPATLPDGRRLRGVSVPGGVYLGRDRKFYGTVGVAPAVRFTVLSYGDVLARVSFEQIVQALRSAVTARLALRKSRGQALQNLVNFLSR
jgi:hypothetical protein